MTPAQVAAELEAVVAAISAAFGTADLQYELEDTEVRLAELAARLRATAGDTFRAARAPGQLADRLTAGLDGPHADDDTTGAAGLAAEAVRFLNYATGSHAGQGLTCPATVYSVTGHLAVAAERMPQLFGQLTGWLDAECTAGRLGDDHGGAVAPLTDRARYYLDGAARHAAALSNALAATQVALATVHGKRTEAGS